MTNRAVQQMIDLQNRITELSELGQLDLLTHGEVALISYALGRYTAELIAQAPAPLPPTPRPERNKAKGKAGK